MTKSADETLKGLSEQQVQELRKTYGMNTLSGKKGSPVFNSLKNIVTEPMFILLAVACALYFFLGDLTEAMMMVVSILFVAGIELYQETKSERALDALRAYTRAGVHTLRNGKWVVLPSEALVPEDIVRLEEGENIPADGLIHLANDCSVDESVLTGESLPVEKNVGEMLFQGSTIASGSCTLRITATGNSTSLGKLGKSIDDIETARTPLQIQIRRFVRNMGILGAVAFVVVFVLNFWAENDVWKALLFSLTLAMAILPEEIPVAFSAFMGLGAYRMIKHGILAKQPKTVESLGSATVICLDKTGTITQNRMSVAEIADFSGKGRPLPYALWASEPEPFDAMEKALLDEYKILNNNDLRIGYRLTKEYPLSGRPPMMTHVWENGTTRIVATKGAVERVLKVCRIEGAAREAVMDKAEQMADKGFRVLAVAGAEHASIDFPVDQDDYNWEFEGLVAFYDPPKTNIRTVFQKFYRAGLRIVMITGDHASTAKNIARHSGLEGWELTMTGAEVMQLDPEALRDAVRRVNVFSRMFPDAKLKVVNALKENGEIVAMTGDGVNDGPALKAAQIGVAMGKKGTEIAKNAASLVLMKDNLLAMVRAVAMGRRIYDNLRKAIRYVISIHLPIILMVLVPLLLGWPYTHILLPLHVIFLELVMDPTAAIAFENEPAEPNLMRKPPRRQQNSFFSWKELAVSLLQGLVITGFVLGMYWYAVSCANSGEAYVRSMVFATMVSANVFLTLSNRSFDYAIHRTIWYKNPVLPRILLISMLMLLAILYIPLLHRIFQMAPLSLADFLRCLLVGLASNIWFEVYKALRSPTPPNRKAVFN